MLNSGDVAELEDAVNNVISFWLPDAVSRSRLLESGYDNNHDSKFLLDLPENPVQVRILPSP